MKIASIVVTFNAMTNNWIEKCLQSLNKSDIHDIIIVDNNSADDTCTYIKAKFPKAILVESNENLGFGKANNIGLEIALKNNNDFFFLLNQDAQTEKDTPVKLAKLMEQYPEFGVISPLHLNGKGTALDFGFAIQTGPNHCKDLYSDALLNKIKDRIYTTPFICAAAWMISKKCLEKTGGFNPTFFHYGEDTDYMLRLHFKGFKAGVYPFAKIYHDREQRDPEKNLYRFSLNKNLELIKYSQPKTRHNIEKDIKNFKIRKIISLLKFKKKAATEWDEKIKFLNANKKNILKNRTTAESHHPYPFLKT